MCQVSHTHTSTQPVLESKVNHSEMPLMNISSVLKALLFVISLRENLLKT